MKQLGGIIGVSAGNLHKSLFKTRIEAARRFLPTSANNTTKHLENK